MKSTKFGRMVEDFIMMFFSKRVPRSGASLSYYLTLSVFPLLIIIIMILGKLNIQPESLYVAFEGVIPSSTIDVFTQYLSYVISNTSPALFWAAIAVIVAMSSAAFRVITSTAADIQGIALFKGPWGFLFSFIFSLIFLAMIYILIIIVVTGRTFINWLKGFINLSGLVLSWTWMRFIVMFLLLFIVVYITYALCAPKGLKYRVWLGALLGSAAIVVLSILFSEFIQYSNRYSLVYGSIASIIILMVWLYFCSTVLVSGNLLNFVLNKYKRGFYDKITSFEGLDETKTL